MVVVSKPYHRRQVVPVPWGTHSTVSLFVPAITEGIASHYILQRKRRPFLSAEAPFPRLTSLPCSLIAWAIQIVLISQLVHSVIFLWPVFLAGPYIFPRQRPCLWIPPNLPHSPTDEKRLHGILEGRKWPSFPKSWVWGETGITFSISDSYLFSDRWDFLHPLLHLILYKVGATISPSEGREWRLRNFAQSY